MTVAKDADPHKSAARAELARDYELFFVRCLKVLTKKNGLQPFALNSSQRRVVAEIARLRAAGIPPRLIILKARQTGISTLIEGLLFADCFLRDGRSALVVADTDPHAQNVLAMARRYNRYLPDELRVKERADNTKALGWPWESRMQVETAGEVRSMTGQGLHLSEFAFYEDPETVIQAAMETMPVDVDTLAVIESTANGEGNLFHRLWVGAIAASEDPDIHPWEKGWVPIFIPWHEHEEYTLAAWFGEADLTKEERELRARFNLTIDQIAWRRRKILEKGGDVESFTIENPATWQEAFALSGRPIFTKEDCDHYARLVPARGHPDYERSLWAMATPCEIEWDDVEKRPIAVAQDRGRLRIFKPYNPRHTYVIGADPSEGDPKSDPSPIEVFDQMEMEQAAEWWGRCPPDVLGKYAGWLGMMYGTAEVNAEANNHGIMFFYALLEMGYSNLYFRGTHEEDVSGAVGTKPGIWETNKTKHAMTDTARRWARERRGAIYSPILLGEMRVAQYVKKDDAKATKITKPSGAHIDALISWLIALYTHRGSAENPLLPLPEKELVAAASYVLSLRGRDPGAAEAASAGLIGMSCADLDAALEAKYQRRERSERLGFGEAR